MIRISHFNPSQKVKNLHLLKLKCIINISQLLVTLFFQLLSLFQMFSIRQRRTRFTPRLRRLSQMKDRLEKLTLILDEQEDILNQLLVIYGLRVNENLKKYFTILQSELTQQRTPRLNIILEYFHIMDLSNLMIHCA